MDYDIVKSIITVLILGFMIGLERSMTYLFKNEQSFAGSRTFALISLLGYLSGWMEKYIDDFAIISTIIIGFFIALSYYLKVQKYQKKGMTTQIAAFITFFLGLMVYYNLTNYAIFIGVLMIVLLELKPKLRVFEAHISPTDINSVVLLLVMSFVVLPILPDKMVGPYNLFNPYKTWMMAVIIAAISFIGYAAIKILGHKRGIFLTGAAGGLISSTAVSISLSKMFQKNYQLINNYTSGIAIACTFMFFRVFFEAFVINPQLAFRLAPSFLAAAFAGVLYSYYLYKNSKIVDIDFENPAISKNPLQLSEAIKFGILFGIIYGAISFVETKFGNIGVYIVSFFSGISDVDAITLSLSQMAKDNKLEEFVSMNGIVIASITNSLVKLFIVFWLGGAKLGFKIAQFFILTLSILIIGLYITENFI